MAHTVTAGDIFVTSWGYEQTNVEFYEVIRATSKTAWLRRIATEKEPLTFMSEEVMPKPGEYVGEEVLQRRFQSWANPDEPAVRINPVANARLWDGTARYASHYA